MHSFSDGASVETARLLLRPFRTDDLDDLQKTLGRGDVMADWVDNAGSGGFTTEQTRAAIAGYQSDWTDHGVGKWAVTTKDSGALIGYCGLSPVDYLPEIEPATELGYRLHPDYWNRGYATEAALASLRFGFVELNLDRIVAVHTVDNTASARVLEKLGMSFVRTVTYTSKRSGASSPMHVLELSRDEWRRSST